MIVRLRDVSWRMRPYIRDDRTELECVDGVVCVGGGRHASIDKRPRVDRDAIGRAVWKETASCAGIDVCAVEPSPNRALCYAVCVPPEFMITMSTKRMIRCHTHKEELTIRVDLRHRSSPSDRRAETGETGDKRDRVCLKHASRERFHGYQTYHSF
jgi:hypothetical protein